MNLTNSRRFSKTGRIMEAHVYYDPEDICHLEQTKRIILFVFDQPILAMPFTQETGRGWRVGVLHEMSL